MPTTEPARHALYAQLERVLGVEHADTLMAYLPHHKSDGVATKGDLVALRSDFAEVRTDFAELRSEFKRDLVDLRAELRGDLNRLDDVIRDQHKFYVGTVVASLTALTTAFAAVVVLLG